MSPSRMKNKTCQRADELLVSQRPTCNRWCGALRAHLDRFIWWPSTQSCFISGRLDYVLLLDPDIRGREWGWRHCATLPHFKPIHAQVKTSHPSPHPHPQPSKSPVAIGAWQSSRCGYTGSCSHRFAHRRLRAEWDQICKWRTTDGSQGRLYFFSGVVAVVKNAVMHEKDFL